MAVASVLVLCRRPRHLPEAEARRWLAGELRALDAAAGTEAVALVDLVPPGDRFPCQWAWLLRLRLADGVPPAALLEDGPGAALLGDLRLLGMQPTVLVPGKEVPLR